MVKSSVFSLIQQQREGLILKAVTCYQKATCFVESSKCMEQCTAICKCKIHWLELLLSSVPKRRSCLSVCHLTAQSSSWGMLCLQSALCSGGLAPRSPRSPRFLDSTSFRSRTYCHFRQTSLSCDSLRGLKIFLTI